MSPLRVIAGDREDRGFLSLVGAVTSDVGAKRGLGEHLLTSARVGEVAAQIVHEVRQAVRTERCARPPLSPPTGCIAGVVSMALHDVLFRKPAMFLAPGALASAEAADLCGACVEESLQGTSAQAS